MAIVSSFDQWQKDVFFSAAEEVQESADLMESIYRTWIHESSNGLISEELGELLNELNTALGTAKWQLEQFDRAVKLSYKNYLSEENTIARHSQFVSAIQNQITRIENALSDSLSKQGKQSLNWVKLDEEEREDFVNFLSTPPQIVKEIKSVKIESKEVPNLKEEQVLSLNPIQSCELNGGEWQVSIEEDKKELNGRREKEREKEKLVRDRSNLIGFIKRIERIKWSRINSFWKVKREESLSLREKISDFADLRGVALFTQYNSYFGRSLRITFLLLLGIVLIVPFLLYSA